MAHISLKRRRERNGGREGGKVVIALSLNLQDSTNISTRFQGLLQGLNVNIFPPTLFTLSRRLRGHDYQGRRWEGNLEREKRKAGKFLLQTFDRIVSLFRKLISIFTSHSFLFPLSPPPLSLLHLPLTSFFPLIPSPPPLLLPPFSPLNLSTQPISFLSPSFYIVPCSSK